MKRVYTGIDVGSDSIKIVTAEMLQKPHVLGACSVRSIGVKKGVIQNPKEAASAIRLAVKEMEGRLGVKINQAIVNVPSDDVEFAVVGGSTEIIDNTTVQGHDITKVLQDALLGQVPEDRELITVYPISFTLDDKENIQDPRNLEGSHLDVKAVMTTVPKSTVKTILETMKIAGIHVADLAFGVCGDYCMAESTASNKQAGAIINIGFSKTDVSIINKGIMIKSKTLELGSRNIDHDIKYIYKVDTTTARRLKETFAVASFQYADYNDVTEITGKDTTNLVIRQSEISEVIEARLKQILKMAKKEINSLTKREISYIIITGGISELAGFQFLIDECLGTKAMTLNMTTMGARHNKYSSVLGMIKYFHQKLELRGKKYSMFEDNQIEELQGLKKKTSLASDNIISRCFGHFFDN